MIDVEQLKHAALKELAQERDAAQFRAAVEQQKARLRARRERLRKLIRFFTPWRK